MKIQKNQFVAHVKKKNYGIYRRGLKIKKDKKDKLEGLFILQQKLQERLGAGITVDKQQYISIMSLALIDEVMEALRETPFKPWKKTMLFDGEKFKEELVDAWHFIINLSIASGMDADELFKRFEAKNEANHQRIDDGY